MSLRHILYEESPDNKYEIAILIKDSCFNDKEIKKAYVDPLNKLGVKLKELVVFNLPYTPSNKAPVKLIKGYLPTLLPALEQVKAKILLVADPNYFKQLTKMTKTEPYYGHVLPCRIKGYEHMNVILTLNYASLFYDPTQQTKIDRSLDTVMNQRKGLVIVPGTNIIHSARYPDKLQDILFWIEQLHTYPALTCDIEATGLRFYEIEIVSIAFAWDLNNGLAFSLCKNHLDREFDAHTKKVIKQALKTFFKKYKGQLIYHYANYDVKVLISHLFMKKDWSNTKGMLKGLHTMYANTDCTQLIAYLATNTTAGNTLSLKDLAAEFAGNYALDNIDNILQNPMTKILEYNLKDCLATWYVYTKYYPKMVADKQLRVYLDIYRPTMKTVSQMELVGFPMIKAKVEQASKDLNSILERQLRILNNEPIIKDFEKVLRQQAYETKQASLKVKKITLQDIPPIKFNPGSPTQVGILLHEYLNLDIIATTPTGNPATGAKTLKKLRNLIVSDYKLTDEDLS